MPTYRNDVRIATTLFEAAAFHKKIRATCKCGHSSVFDPHALWWLFQRKGWDQRLKVLPGRFRCLRCSSGRVRVALVEEPVTIDRLPMPPEHEWKRAVSRFRS